MAVISALGVLNYQNLRFLQLQLPRFLGSSPALGVAEECLVIRVWPERPSAFSKTVRPVQMSWYKLSNYCEERDLCHAPHPGVALGNWSRSCHAQSSWKCSRAVWTLQRLYRQKRLFPEEWMRPTASLAALTGRRDAHADQGARNQSLLVYPEIFISLNACVVWKRTPCVQYWKHWKPQLWFELLGTFWPLRSADLASFHAAVSGTQMLIVCWIEKRAEKYLHIVSSVLM